MENAKILIVEDEKIVARDIENRLKSFGYAVAAVVSTGEAAIKKVGETHPDLVLMDILLKGEMDGVTAAEQIRARFNIPVIYLTAYADEKTLQRAKITEPFGYIIKPFEERELRTTIEIALYRHKMERKTRESEKRYRDLFDSSIDGVYWTDSEGFFTLINKAGAAMFGHSSAGEVIGKPAADYWYNASDRDAYIEELRRKKSVSAYLVRGRRCTGEIVHVEVSARILEDEDGNYIGTEGILRDVTERKTIEEKLFQISRDWEDTFSSITDMITIHDKDFNIVHANKAAEKILGLPFLEKTPDAKCFKYYHGTEKPPEGCPSCGCLQTGVPATFELFEPHLNMFIEIRAIPRFDSNKQLTGLIHVVRDITERKHAEEELWNVLKRVEDEKARSEAIIAAIGDGITIQDRDFKILYQNQIARNMIGNHIGEYCYMAYEGMERTCEGCPVVMAVKDGKVHTVLRSVLTDKGMMYFENTASALRDSEGKIIAGIEVIRDITERKKAEEKLNELFDEVSKAKTEWEMTFDSAMEIIVLIDKEFNIIRCNKSCADFCGMPLKTIPGHKLFDLFPWSLADMEYLREKIQKEEPTEWIEIKTATGRWFYLSHRPIVDKKGDFLYSVIIATDITSLKSAQEKIHESEEALKERVKELEKFYEMAVGREVKMKKLKEEIMGLKAELEKYKK